MKSPAKDRKDNYSTFFFYDLGVFIANIIMDEMNSLELLSSAYNCYSLCFFFCLRFFFFLYYFGEGNGLGIGLCYCDLWCLVLGFRMFFFIIIKGYHSVFFCAFWKAEGRMGLVGLGKYVGDIYPREYQIAVCYVTCDHFFIVLL
jgi:hypothetical protein